MIGQLTGILLEKQPPQLLLAVNGVGYEIDAPMSTFYKLPECGEGLTLFTHFVVREDAQQLFGFYTKEERQLFRTLLKVNGVGPRLSLTILSSMAINEFVACVQQNDAARLVNVPGVGKKTAERLIIEIRDKISGFATHDPKNLNLISLKTGQHRNKDDATAALIALGYKPQEASRVISRIEADDMSSEEMIRHALKEMV